MRTGLRLVLICFVAAVAFGLTQIAFGGSALEGGIGFAVFFAALVLLGLPRVRQSSRRNRSQ